MKLQHYFLKGSSFLRGQSHRAPFAGRFLREGTKVSGCSSLQWSHVAFYILNSCFLFIKRKSARLWHQDMILQYLEVARAYIHTMTVADALMLQLVHLASEKRWNVACSQDFDCFTSPTFYMTYRHFTWRVSVISIENSVSGYSWIPGGSPATPHTLMLRTRAGQHCITWMSMSYARSMRS